MVSRLPSKYTTSMTFPLVVKSESISSLMRLGCFELLTCFNYLNVDWVVVVWRMNKDVLDAVLIDPSLLRAFPNAGGYFP